MNGLIDGFFDVAADIVNLIDTPHRFIRVGNVDGGHIKARSIEARAFAQFLHYLHHDALPENEVFKLCCLLPNERVLSYYRSDSCPASSALDK